MEQTRHIKTLWLSIGCVGLLFFLRTGYHLFSYMPLLDDFIQYRVYSFYPDPISDVILRIGLLSSRPLAGIFDVFVWAKFWNCLWLALLLMSVAYAISCCAYWKLFEKYMHSGWLFIILFGLAPFLFEGTYWLSASSRIVVSLGFSAAALWLLDVYLSKKTVGPLVAFAIFHLCSLAFYEQTAAISVVLALFLLWERRGKTKPAVWAIPFINGACVAYFYLFVRTGAGLSAGRIRLVTADFLGHFKGVFSQVWEAFAIAGGKITLYGAWDGFWLLHSGWGLLFLVGIVAGAGFTGVLAYRAFLPGKEGRQTVVGCLLFLAGLAPFFILQGQVVTLRCVVAPCMGLALLVDAAARRVLRQGPIVYGTICGILCAVFLLGCVSETDLYYRTGKDDWENVGALCETIKGARDEANIAIIGAPEYYAFNRVQFYEHSYSVFSSQWALSGAVRAKSEDALHCRVYSIRPDAPVHAGYEDFLQYESFFGFDGGQFIPLSMSQDGDTFVFTDAAGQRIFAEAQKQANGYYLVMNDAAK